MRKSKDMNDEKRLSIIREYLETSKTKGQIQQERGLSKNAISKWLSKFAIEYKSTSRISMQKPKESRALEPTKEALDSKDEIIRLKNELRIKNLELKKTQMQRDIYEKMIQIAEVKYAIPIKKNSDAK